MRTTRTDKHPNRHATRKGDETDYLREERQQSYAPRQRRLKDYDYFPSDDHRYRQGSDSDQHNTDAGDRNSQRNTQSRRGGMHDLAPSRHPHLPDNSRRQHGGSWQHGDQRYSHASVPYNTRDGEEGDRHLQGAASYIPASTEDYDWLYTMEQYCMAHNVSRAFWPSDLTTPVIPPPMLTQENLSVDHAPQPLMTERPSQCQTPQSPRGLSLHRTLPHPTRQHLQACTPCSKRSQRPRQRERITHVQQTRQQQQPSNSDYQKNRRRQCSSRQVKTGSKRQNNQ